MKNLIIICVALFGIANITSCKKATTTPITTIDSLKIGLIAYYPFNNNGADSSGHGNDVYYFGNITSTTDRFSRVNSAFHFDGTTSYLAVPDKQELRLNNTNITLSAWVKLDAYGSSFGYNILTKHLAGADNGWAWGVTGQSTGTSGVVTYGPGGGSLSARGTKVMGLNQWHMMTSTYNLTTKQLTIYIDGVLDNITSNGIPSPNATISSMLYIGRDDPTTGTGGYFLQGSLDEVRIYNRVLSLNDIQKLYTYKN